MEAVCLSECYLLVLAQHFRVVVRQDDLHIEVPSFPKLILSTYRSKNRAKDERIQSYREK